MNTEMILKAAAFASRAHANHKRKTNDEPYINHLIRVAYSAAQAGLSDEVIMAAFLHDVVEDTNVNFEDLESEFPPRVVQLVKLMTQWWADHAPKEVKQTEVPKYYAAILKDPDAVALKLLDRADNLNDMADTIAVSPSWAARYLKKSLDEMPPLLASRANPKATEICLAAIERLKAAVNRYQSRSNRSHLSQKHNMRDQEY